MYTTNKRKENHRIGDPNNVRDLPVILHLVNIVVFKVNMYRGSIWNANTVYHKYQCSAVSVHVCVCVCMLPYRYTNKAKKFIYIFLKDTKIMVSVTRVFNLCQRNQHDHFLAPEKLMKAEENSFV